MIVDYVAQKLDKAQTLITQLAGQEHQTKQARRARDRDAQRQAERRAKMLRDQLLEHNDVSVVYLYLAASAMAGDVDFRSAWQDSNLKVDALEQLEQWKVRNLYDTYWANPTPDISILPPFSFSLQFTFALASPYLSKDDNVFYIVDNPIVRDKVFRLPMVRPTAWKGSLRAALWQLGHQDDERVRHLFGTANDEAGTGQAGRLIFFPTFFTKTSLEIINPHDRKTKTGKNPILFECVPQDAKGTFTLLYVPIDLIGADETETRRQVADDLVAVAEGVRVMMTVYGFGAKTSSGFGVVADLVEEGGLTIRTEAKPVPFPFDSLPALSALADAAAEELRPGGAR